ncbi:HAD family hydrolase [Virgibacillus ainsalahensis]
MKFIAIDMDGTLLSEDISISEANKKAIHEAQRRGHVVAISSGRSLHDTDQLLKDANLKCPIITGNGGLAFNNGEVLEHHILHTDLISELIETIEDSDVYYEIYTNNGVLIKEEGKSLLHNELKQLEDQTNLEWAKNIIAIQYKQHRLIPVPDYSTIDFSEKGVYKIFILSFDEEKLAKLRETLEGREDIAITTSGEQKLEISHNKASKGNAMKFLAEHFNIPFGETVAIGDNFNDISMFEAASISIAMENAKDAVKGQADHVTKNHNEDGVAYAFWQWIL